MPEPTDCEATSVAEIRLPLDRDTVRRLAEGCTFDLRQASIREMNGLVNAIEARLKTRTRAEWLERLEGAGFPFGPVNDLDELARDPHVRERSLFTTMDDGRTPCIRSPLRFSRTPIRNYRRPPGLDEHPDAEF